MQPKPNPAERTATGSSFPAPLPLARTALERLGLDDGPAPLEGPGAARRLAELIRLRLPGTTISTGSLLALQAIHELTHELLDRYRGERDPELGRRVLRWLSDRLGPGPLETFLVAFVARYPPPPVARGAISPVGFLAGATGGRPHRDLVLGNLLFLALVQENPATEPVRDLLDDEELPAQALRGVVEHLEDFFTEEPAYDLASRLRDALDEPDEAADSPLPRRSLLDALRAPRRESPDSLFGQLDYLRRRTTHTLGDRLAPLLRAEDILREEERPIFPPGPGPVEAPRDEELTGPARFSADAPWMAGLVLLAKNVRVWLHQLSRRAGETLDRLDQVPDEELDRIAAWGITGLWLIGVWERSEASAVIKRLSGTVPGDPATADALGASAYSIEDYRIAEDLGGDAALEELSRRALARGIRLGSDFVPNHMGIDSRWVRDHPERFLSLVEPPFATYRFSGPDLSTDPDIRIFLEDHYYDRSDAAVVFERHDRRDGETRYLYHGNDGTSTPWNDTAQLDFLRPDTREAVIETILDVVRRFPILRFDAAMTLAKRHVRRLWYPAPGGAGAIPSRAEHGLDDPAFEAHMPEEFWRQVVDRVAREAPDTLLLAEAFWLMEGYFVRGLGLNRVYNSAFMHMVRDERNGEYLESLAQASARDPRILGRYANFLTNPDEATAAGQFGRGDKYFAACSLLATLPGLPLLGHGQLEGLGEKYGMEFYRPQFDEDANPSVVERHEREILPLLRRRSLFASGEELRLFPGTAPEGGQVDDLYAFTNCLGSARALVLVNNGPRAIRAVLRRCAPFRPVGAPPGTTRSRSVAGALGAGRGGWLVARDLDRGGEILFAADRLETDGLDCALGPYERRVFLEIESLSTDPESPWAALPTTADGAATPLPELLVLADGARAGHEAAAALLDPGLLQPLLAGGPDANEAVAEPDWNAALERAWALWHGEATPGDGGPETSQSGAGGPSLDAARQALDAWLEARETASPAPSTATEKIAHSNGSQDASEGAGEEAGEPAALRQTAEPPTGDFAPAVANVATLLRLLPGSLEPELVAFRLSRSLQRLGVAPEDARRAGRQLVDELAETDLPAEAPSARTLARPQTPGPEGAQPATAGGRGDATATPGPPNEASLSSGDRTAAPRAVEKTAGPDPPGRDQGQPADGESTAEETGKGVRPASAEAALAHRRDAPPNAPSGDRPTGGDTPGSGSKRPPRSPSE